MKVENLCSEVIKIFVIALVLHKLVSNRDLGTELCYYARQMHSFQLFALLLWDQADPFSAHNLH